jgi:hypothetical protein
MAAIITDQFRISNVKNFISIASTGQNTYYSFIGLTNPGDIESDWNTSPPSPKDSFEQENDYWDSMVALKRINASDIRPVIRKITWETGVTYDMYRHDISRTNPSNPSGALSLYNANYYVLTSEYKVYICLSNGTDPENPLGRPSLDEPQFTDLEPRTAGTSGDGYIWKYLYTLTPTDILKFDSINFIPVPSDWSTSTSNALIRNNASTSGQLKIINILDRGSGIGTASVTYTNVPIKGDGTGAEATITINNNSTVETITISNGGSGYTYGTVDIIGGGLPTGSSSPQFDVIIPPNGGHGHDVYRELGSYYVCLYAKFENDNENPDFITGNEISRIGIVENPLQYDSSSLLNADKVSALYAVKLVGITDVDDYKSASFTPDSYVTQTIGTGVTAVGRVVSYDSNTGVLKYWQDKRNAGFNVNGSQDTTPEYGITQNRFTSDLSSGGSLIVSGGSVNLNIDSNFGTEINPGITTNINNKTYQLGQIFIGGVSNPEVKKYSGDIIYVDNRPTITRSQNQKEFLKAILRF